MNRLGGWLGALLRRPPTAPHLVVGARGERAAARFLKRAGCRVVARSLQTPAGEADLVCIDKASGAVILVEVKSRIQEGGGASISPTTAINADKRRRLAATAKSLASHPRFAGRTIRIDVVTVEYRSADDPDPRITHYPNAVTADATLR